MTTDRTIRFAAPVYPGGRHCLLSGSITVGAVFPPLGDPGTAKQNLAWVWRLFPFGANPARAWLLAILKAHRAQDGKGGAHD